MHIDYDEYQRLSDSTHESVGVGKGFLKLHDQNVEGEDGMWSKSARIPGSIQPCRDAGSVYVQVQ